MRAVTLRQIDGLRRVRCSVSAPCTWCRAWPDARLGSPPGGRRTTVRSLRPTPTASPDAVPAPAPQPPATDRRRPRTSDAADRDVPTEPTSRSRSARRSVAAAHGDRRRPQPAAAVEPASARPSRTPFVPAPDEDDNPPEPVTDLESCARPPGPVDGWAGRRGTDDVGVVRLPGLVERLRGEDHQRHRGHPRLVQRRQRHSTWCWSRRSTRPATRASPGDPAGDPTEADPDAPTPSRRAVDTGPHPTPTREPPPRRRARHPPSADGSH